MKYFDRLFKKNKKINQNYKHDLVNQNLEVSEQVRNFNFEVINIRENELGALKRSFEPIVREAAKRLEKKGSEPEKNFKAIIPPELIESFKNGDLSFMKSTDGSLLPNIIDEKNQIVKKVRLEEIEIAPQDIAVVNELSDRILNQKLDAISDQLDIIIDLAEEINKSLQNKNYGKIIGAIRTIEQSYLSEGRNTRQQLQNNAQGVLNESIAVLEMELEDGIQYFRNWDNRNFFINEYSSFRIKRKFNKLMIDYLYLNNAKSALIELKREQGMSKENLHLMTEDLKEIDYQLIDAEINKWLPPKTNENSWHHDLLNHLYISNSRLVIEYNMDELLEDGNE